MSTRMSPGVNDCHCFSTFHYYHCKILILDRLLTFLVTRDEATLINEEIKPVAIAIIKLKASSSQPAENSDS